MPMECHPFTSRRWFGPLLGWVLRLAVTLCALALACLGVLAQAPAHTTSSATNIVAPETNTPIVPTFAVKRFEVTGSTTLSQENIDRVMRDAIGTNISLPQLRRALVHLQEAYRERGFTKAGVTLPRQRLTDGVVKIRVVEGPNASKPEVPVTNASPALEAWTAPTYAIEHFEVRGNTALKPEEIDQIIGPLAGPAVTEEQIQKALARLQAAYRERGFTRAAVTLRQQVLVDGTVAIEINEGKTLDAELAALTAKTNAAPAAPPARTFTVRQYEVLGNTLLSAEAITPIFTNAVGTNITLAQIQKALGELQLAYRERGFATVSVGLPQQQLTNAIVKVQVTEGVLTDIRVSGNRFFTSNNVARALPSLTTNSQLNSRVFQRELDLANQNRDRQIYPTIGPGPEPGTSALTLRVKDRLPLHGRIDVNNHNTPGTPDWRINASLSYANLWQREHQLGLSYGFTPEEFKSDGLMSDFFFNRPLIANYGAYYRMPFGDAGSVQEQIGASAGRFGYDEATRQFRLPPAGARPDLTFYASGSSTDTGVKYGRENLVSQTPLLTIVSQDSGQNLTINNSAGGRVNIPFAIDDNRRFSFSAGLDAKYYSIDSYNTNNFFITTVVTNAQGSQTIESVVSSPQPTRRVAFAYLPLSLGADYFQTDKGGSFSANLSLSANFVGDDEDFSRSSYSRDAQADYAKLTLSLTRDQTVFKNWSLLLRASGQAATGPLISNEQFAMGGMASVRGYYEGDQYGDTGWFGSAELRTPFITAHAPIWSGSVPAWLRGSIFFDVAQRYPLDTSPGHDPFRTLMGAGFGLSANVNNHLDMRIAVGWPLRDSFNTEAYEPRVNFSLGGQF